MSQVNVNLFVALMLCLCLPTGGQPCRICAPGGGADSCLPMSPPEGVTVNGSICSSIENQHKDYHNKLCERYPPPKGYVYECTTPGTTNTFSCSSSCGPPMEDVGKGINLDLLQGGGLLANFNSRPRGAGLFDFNTFNADSNTRGNANLGRFATLASLNNNNNNNNFNNDNFNNNNNNNNFNLFRNNRNNNFNVFNTKAGATGNGNFRSNVLTQAGSGPISGGIAASRPGPRSQNPRQPVGSTLLDPAPPRNEGSPRNQPDYDAPSLPAQSRPQDQPPPVGTLTPDAETNHPSQPTQEDMNHPLDSPQDEPLSSDEPARGSDPNVDKGNYSPESGPGAGVILEENTDFVSSPPPASSYPGQDVKTVVDPQTDLDPRTVNGGGRLPIDNNPQYVEESPSAGEEYAKDLPTDRYSEQGKSEDDPGEGIPPEILTSKTSSDYPDKENRHPEGSVEKGETSAGENPSEPSYGSPFAGVTYPADQGSDEADPVSQPPENPERYIDAAAEATGTYPDLPPPPPPLPPPPQTYGDPSPGVESSSGLSQTAGEDGTGEHPVTSSPDAGPDTADQHNAGVSSNQPPPLSRENDEPPSDPNSYYQDNPEIPSYPGSQPPADETYPGLDSDPAEEGSTDPLRDTTTTTVLPIFHPDPVDSSGAHDYAEEAASYSSSSPPREEEEEKEEGEGKEEDEKGEDTGDGGEYPFAVVVEGEEEGGGSSSSRGAPRPGILEAPKDTPSGEGYDHTNPYSSPPTPYPTIPNTDNNNNNNNGDNDDDHVDDDNTASNKNSNNDNYNSNSDNVNNNNNNNNNQQAEASQNSEKNSNTNTYDDNKNANYDNNNNNNDKINNSNNNNDDNNNNNNNLPPESFQNPFKNPSSPYRKRPDHFESNPAFVGTSLFSEGFLDSPGERIHPGAVAPRPRGPDAVDIGANQIFPGFQDFEKGATEVLGMGGSDSHPNGNQQPDIFSLFLQPTNLNQPARGRNSRPSPQQPLGFRGALNPAENPGQNHRGEAGGGFQRTPFTGVSGGRGGQNSPGVVFGGGGDVVLQGGRTGGYRVGGVRGASNGAVTAGSLPTPRRTNSNLPAAPSSTPYLSTPNLPPQPRAGGGGGTRVPHPQYPGQRDAAAAGGSGFAEPRRGAAATLDSGGRDPTGLPGSSGFGSGARRGFVGFGSPERKDEFGFPGSFGGFNDEGFNSNNFHDKQLSDDLFKNADTSSTETEQSSSAAAAAAASEGPQS